MAKKKFIDKKKAATFELCPRDTSDPRYSDAPGGDKVFLRVDQNPVNINGFTEEEEEEDNSRFEDAPGDSSNPLPSHPRKEILELGYRDDGYNYLENLREIKNSGGGSNFYPNPKFEIDLSPCDVKAYDASRVKISGMLNEEEVNDNSMYSVADKTVRVEVKKAFDPEVAALLENSDIVNLEEDSVVEANLTQQVEAHGVSNEELEVSEESDEPELCTGVGDLADDFVILANITQQEEALVVNNDEVKFSEPENPRIPRRIDELFDQLQVNEYGSDSDENGGYIAEEFVDQNVQNLIYEKPKDYEVEEKYMNPADILKNSDVKDKEELDSAAKIIRRCVEYAENFGNEDEFIEVNEESKDENKMWDCESIVSKYSNFDNHPGKIYAPERAKKRLSEMSCLNGSKMITLQGKEKLPMEYLPGKKGEVKTVTARGELVLKRKSVGEETKEEKKERKNGVKSEKREARMMKKEMKELYRGETQRAQRVVAVSLPFSIHL